MRGKGIEHTLRGIKLLKMALQHPKAEEDRSGATKERKDPKEKSEIGG
jgi:hypothetical protein